jgi:phytoene dehydrogenase-like protein
MRNVVIVGGGLGGLASAVYLAQAGYQVTLFEKSTEPGGRARTSFTTPLHLSLSTLRYEVSLAPQLQMLLLQLLENSIRSQ